MNQTTPIVCSNTFAKMPVVRFAGFDFSLAFIEGEFCATHKGFSAYGKTQAKAIALCYAMMQDTFLGEDED